jgi:D-aspartate ligase
MSSPIVAEGSPNMIQRNAIDHSSPALVVGMSIHGLAVARALAKSGVCVYGLCDTAVSGAPTAKTRFAKVLMHAGINTDSITNALMDLSVEIDSSHKIVLFPTSDRIVKSIATAWDVLSERYLLSWSHCRDLVLRLQRKDCLPEHCERVGIRYPRSRILATPGDIDDIGSDLRFPLIVKPAQPLSSFKAIRLATKVELARVVDTFGRDLPFVVQEWIEGPEPSLYACTTYLESGQPLFMYASRKLAASPPGLGQGTVFETCDQPEVVRLTETFLGPLGMSGPIAVEFKRDDEGQFWFIEPNVGRTEYCVDLVIQSGYNLPYIEYLHATGQIPGIPLPNRARNCVWFDTDKDLACLFANFSALRTFARDRRRAVFPYWGHGDPMPYWSSLTQQSRTLLRAGARRLTQPLRQKLHAGLDHSSG